MILIDWNPDFQSALDWPPRRPRKILDANAGGSATLFVQRSRNNLAGHRRRWPIFWKEIADARAAKPDVHAAHVGNRISVLCQLPSYARCNSPRFFKIRR